MLSVRNVVSDMIGVLSVSDVITSVSNVISDMIGVYQWCYE